MKPTQTVTDTPTDQVPRLVSRSVFVRDFAEPDDGEVEYAGLWTFEADGRRWVTDRYLVMDETLLGDLAGLGVTERPPNDLSERLMGELLAPEWDAVTGAFQPHYLGELALAGVSVCGTTGMPGSYSANALRRGPHVVGGLMPMRAGFGLRAVPAVLVAAESRLRGECPWLTARGRWLVAASSLDLLIPVDGWS